MIMNLTTQAQLKLLYSLSLLSLLVYCIDCIAVSTSKQIAGVTSALLTQLFAHQNFIFIRLETFGGDGR